jgi:hypothetical protein
MKLYFENFLKKESNVSIKDNEKKVTKEAPFISKKEKNQIELFSLFFKKTNNRCKIVISDKNPFKKNEIFIKINLKDIIIKETSTIIVNKECSEIFILELEELLFLKKYMLINNEHYYFSNIYLNGGFKKKYNQILKNNYECNYNDSNSIYERDIVLNNNGKLKIEENELSNDLIKDEVLYRAKIKEIKFKNLTPKNFIFNKKEEELIPLKKEIKINIKSNEDLLKYNKLFKNLLEYSKLSFNNSNEGIIKLFLQKNILNEKVTNNIRINNETYSDLLFKNVKKTNNKRYILKKEKKTLYYPQNKLQTKEIKTIKVEKEITDFFGKKYNFVFIFSFIIYTFEKGNIYILNFKDELVKEPNITHPQKILSI